MTTVQARLAEAMLATRSAHGEAYAHDLALAALARLRALRPDVAALLDGHAVAVPMPGQETPAMHAAGYVEAQAIAAGGAASVNSALRLWRAMLAAAPFAAGTVEET